jgi:diguanylate cyclase (GGDEF)-like protein
VLQKTRNYLAPAEQTARECSNLMGRGLINPNTPSFEAFLLEQLVTNPQLTGIYFGANDGSFTYAKRAATGFTLKRIAMLGGTRQVSFEEFDPQLNPLSTRVEKKDSYDPRKRGWYEEAIARQGLIWTGPYVFFTSQKPGITVALPTTTRDRRITGVFGVDIEISEISKFIATIPTSPHGASFIVTNSGEVVGMPKLDQKLPPGSSGLPKLSEVASPEALTLQRVAGQDNDFHVFQVAGKPWVGLIRPLVINQDADWRLGIHAPQADFVGSTEALFNRQWLQALLISVGAFLISIPLIWRVSSPIEAWYHRATTDELTTLLNRSEFLQRAKKILANQTGTSVVVMLDLDGFKNVNDVFGHAAGDTILQGVAERLHQLVRHHDLIARFGGDEFALFLPDINAATATLRLEAWRKEIAAPFKEVVTISAGLVELQRSDRLEDRLHEADLALLKAKSEGKDRIIGSFSKGPQPV